MARQKNELKAYEKTRGFKKFLKKMNDRSLVREETGSRPFQPRQHPAQDKAQERPISLEENGGQHVPRM